MPSPQAYGAVLAWLRSQGFRLVAGSANRLTLTVRGTRRQAERAFHVRIVQLSGDAGVSYANVDAPALPRSVARHVLDIAGLSTLATPRPNSLLVAIGMGWTVWMKIRHAEQAISANTQSSIEIKTGESESREIIL